MSIASTTRKAGPYSCNGVTTAFPFAFKVFTSADVLVILTTAAGTESELTLGTDFTVTLNADQDANPGGTVTTASAYATGYKITLTSQVADTQPTVLTNQGGFYPKVVNDALDRATIQIQQLAEQVSRAVKVKISSGISPDDLIASIDTAAAAATTAAEAAAGSATAASGSASSAASSAAAAASSAASIGFTLTDVQHGGFAVSTAGGTSDAITGNYTPAISALTDGLELSFYAASPNATTTPTFTPNTGVISTATIVKGNNVALSAGDIQPGWNKVKWAATLGKWGLLNPATGVSVSGNRGAVYGLTISNNVSDANNDIDIAPGECSDSTNIAVMALSTVLTKQLDLAWAAGTNHGGLDTGSKANSTWYHIYLIKKDSDGSIDALFSTSASAPTMPSGWTAKRLIRSVKTDSSGNIIAFSMQGNVVQWKANMGLDVDVTNLGAARSTYTLGSVPPGYLVEAIFNAVTTSAGSEIVTISHPDQLDAAPSQSVWPLCTFSVRSRDNGNQFCNTNSSAQVAARSSISSTTLKIAVTGWRYIPEAM